MRRQIPYLSHRPEEILALQKVADKVEKVMEKNYLQTTHFLSPKEQALTEKMLRQKGLPTHIWWGGYPQAERKILIILPSYMEEINLDPLSYLRLYFSSYRPLRHGDILGSILGLGLDRQVLGDILLGENHADIIVQKDIVPFLLLHYHKAGHVSIEIETLSSQENLMIPPKNYHTKSHTIASLRLDVYVSEVFRLSRQKAKEAIQSGLVFVNGLEETKPHLILEEEDTINLRGKGKTKLLSIGNLSRKERQWIEVLYYGEP